MNQVYIDGKIQKKPEIRFTTSGKKVVSGSLEWSRKFKDKDKKGWFKWQAWGAAADQTQYLDEGSMVMFVAELETNSWENKEGKKVYETRLNVQQAIPVTITPQPAMPLDDEFVF